MSVSADAEVAGVTNVQAKALSATRTVAISTVWNLLGRAGPILVAMAATPTLVSQLGVARWGVFTIALSLVGIFGIFDFGLGRALIRSIAERIGAGEEHAAGNPCDYKHCGAGGIWDTRGCVRCVGRAFLGEALAAHRYRLAG